MRNFIILFQGKEGSTPIVAILDNHKDVAIVRSKRPRSAGWEPFDVHGGRSMSHDTVRQCLEVIFGPDEVDSERLNHIYKRDRNIDLAEIKAGGCTGVKMRWKSPKVITSWMSESGYKKFLAQYVAKLGVLYNLMYRRLLFRLMKKYQLVVFILVRQDILRWSLSKYHGDGFGRKGHLQFGLAKKKIGREDIPAIHVNPVRFRKILKHSATTLRKKRRTMEYLRNRGIEVYPLFYEDFLQDKTRFFKQMLTPLAADTSDQAIDNMLSKGMLFQKVHSEDISEFVLNHEQISTIFGQCEHPWKESFAYQDSAANAID